MIVYPVYVFHDIAALNFKKNDFFLNDSSSKTTVSSAANFITAYEESVKSRLPFSNP